MHRKQPPCWRPEGSQNPKASRQGIMSKADKSWALKDVRSHPALTPPYPGGGSSSSVSAGGTVKQ